MHCIHGEDESDETCKGRLSFPEEATIECIENRLGYNITIKAIPCDGVKECRGGSDEECEEDKLIVLGVVVVLFILTNVIYHYLKWCHLPMRDKVIQLATCNPITDYSHFIGDDLAKLKVRINEILFKHIESIECVSYLE